MKPLPTVVAVFLLAVLTGPIASFSDKVRYDGIEFVPLKRHASLSSNTHKTGCAPLTGDTTRLFFRFRNHTWLAIWRFRLFRCVND